MQPPPDKKKSSSPPKKDATPAAKGAGPPPPAKGAPAPLAKGKGAKPVKPVMRNMHHLQSMRNIYAALGLAAGVAAAFYVLVNRRRRNAYADFYADYDAEAAFQRMMMAGRLDSCPPPPPPKKK